MRRRAPLTWPGFMPPGLTIACFKALWSRAFSPQRTAIFVDGLRKAGLPEE
jgi:hypothetical protein